LAKAVTKTGKGAIADIWSDAKAAHAELEANAFTDPHPDLARDGIKAGQWPGAPHDAMPPKCPVQVIGTDQEGMVWCRTATGDLASIAKWDMQTAVRLFAPHTNFAYWAWPAFGKEKQTDPETGEVKEVLRVKRVERDKLFTCLATEAARRPPFDPSKQHRGRGGWKTDDGAFLWHSGKYLWRSVNSRLQNVPPGEIDGYHYTRGASTIEPWAGPVSHAESPARRILEDLKSWNWERPYLDPILVLGWIVTAFMGAANDVRPVIFTTGGFGVGKSTMQKLLRGVLKGIVFDAEDTTPAGIYQQMRQDALPVMVDELESEAGSDRASNVLKLARIAYSGGRVARGGSDHVGTTFQLYCSFFCSAINPPPMGDQDKSRMAVLNLGRMKPKTDKRADFTLKDTDGRMMLRQVMDGWPEYQDRTRNWWWTLLAGLKGIDSRSIDTYGTLLAAAEMVVGQEALEDAGLPVADEQRLAEIISEATAAERAERLDNWHRCLNHLLACTIDAWRDGVKPTVGGVMDDLGADGSEGSLLNARSKLKLVNLGCMPRGRFDADAPLAEQQGPYLAVPLQQLPQLTKLFGGTDFNRGVWATSLKQAPADIVLRDRDKQTVKIDGSAHRCLLVNMRAFARYAEQQ
jgi:hypothetical protein